MRNWDFWSPIDFTFCEIVRIVFQAQYVCRRERGTHFMIKLPVYQKKEVLIFKQQFCVSLSAGNTISKLKIGEKFSWCCNSPPRSTNSISEKPDLLTNTSLCSDSSQYAIFSQSLVTADFFYFLGSLKFYLKQKEKFSVWSFTENASFMSFH